MSIPSAPSANNTRAIVVSSFRFLSSENMQAAGPSTMMQGWPTDEQFAENATDTERLESDLPVFEIRQGLQPFPSNEEIAQDLSRTLWDGAHAIAGHLSYTDDGLRGLTRSILDLRRAQFNMDAVREASMQGLALTECRLQECHSFKAHVQTPIGTRNMVAILAAGLTWQEIEPMKVVGYEGRLLYGGGLVLCSRELIWPQEKSMARCVLYTSEKHAYLQVVYGETDQMWSNMMRHLCFSLTVGPDATLQSPGFLSDFVSSVYVLVSDLVRFADYDVMDEELAIINDIWTTYSERHNCLAGVFPVLLSATSGEKHEIIEQLNSTCSLMFLEACVRDSLICGSDEVDAVETALKFSKAIDKLRCIREVSEDEANRVYTADDLVILPHIANTDYFLMRLHETLNAASYDYMTMNSTTHPTAAMTLSEYAVATDEELEGSIFAARITSRPETSRYEMMTGKTVVGKEYVRYTAVMNGSELRCTITSQVASGERRSYRILETRSAASVPLHESAEQDEDCKEVINSFLSGECGQEAARWALDRIVEGQIKVSEKSCCSIRHCVETYADGPGVLRIDCCISALAIQERPVVYHSGTNVGRLVLHEDLEAQIVEMRNGRYLITRRETGVELDSADWKQCALNKVMQLA